MSNIADSRNLFDIFHALGKFHGIFDISRPVSDNRNNTIIGTFGDIESPFNFVSGALSFTNFFFQIINGFLQSILIGVMIFSESISDVGFHSSSDVAEFNWFISISSQSISQKSRSFVESCVKFILIWHFFVIFLGIFMHRPV